MRKALDALAKSGIEYVELALEDCDKPLHNRKLMITGINPWKDNEFIRAVLVQNWRRE